MNNINDEDVTLPKTEKEWQELNLRLRDAGMPQLIIKDGYVYKDELHMILGIGLKIES